MDERKSKKEIKEKRQGKGTDTALAGWLDEPELLCDLARPELLPPAVHQGLGSDLVCHQAFCSQANGPLLAGRGGTLQVRVLYSLQEE